MDDFERRVIEISEQLKIVLPMANERMHDIEGRLTEVEEKAAEIKAVKDALSAMKISNDKFGDRLWELFVKFGPWLAVAGVTIWELTKK